MTLTRERESKRITLLTVTNPELFPRDSNVKTGRFKCVANPGVNAILWCSEVNGFHRRYWLAAPFRGNQPGVRLHGMRVPELLFPVQPETNPAISLDQINQPTLQSFLTNQPNQAKTNAIYLIGNRIHTHWPVY